MIYCLILEKEFSTNYAHVCRFFYVINPRKFSTFFTYYSICGVSIKVVDKKSYKQIKITIFSTKNLPTQNTSAITPSQGNSHIRKVVIHFGINNISISTCGVF